MANSFSLQWFVGFVEADGCFSSRNDRKWVTPRFQLALRADDYPLLLMMQEQLGIGRLGKSWRTHYRVDTEGRVYTTTTPMARWDVRSKLELLALVEIFDANPLLSRKAEDYRVWRELVMEYRKPAIERDRSHMRYLGQKLTWVKKMRDESEAAEPEKDWEQLYLFPW